MKLSANYLFSPALMRARKARTSAARQPVAQVTLHGTIVTVLGEAGAPLPAVESAAAVNQRKFYLRADRNPVCFHCGSPLTAASTSKGTREYRYYRRAKRDQQGRAACLTKPVSASAID